MNFLLWCSFEDVKCFVYYWVFYVGVVCCVSVEGWFVEELFARFVFYVLVGVWDGCDLLIERVIVRLLSVTSGSLLFG